MRYIETSRGTVEVRAFANDTSYVSVTSMRGGETWRIRSKFAFTASSPYIVALHGVVLEHTEAGLVASTAFALFETAYKNSMYISGLVATQKAFYVLFNNDKPPMRWDVVSQVGTVFRPDVLMGRWRVTDCGMLSWYTQSPVGWLYIYLLPDDVTWKHFASAHSLEALPFFRVGTRIHDLKGALFIQGLGDYCICRIENRIVLFVSTSRNLTEYHTHAGDALTLTERHYLERDEGDIILLKCVNSTGDLPVALDYHERQVAAKRFAETAAEVDAKRVCGKGEEE